jgi:hypothetical protein
MTNHLAPTSWIDDHLIRKQTYEAACSSALEYSATIRTPRGVCLSDDLTAVRSVVLLHKLVTKLVHGQFPGPVATSPLKLSPFGYRLFYAGKECSQKFVTRSFRNHRFHPLVELYWKHSSHLQLPSDARDLDDQDVRALLSCFERVRLDARSSAFRSHRDGHVALVRKNTRRLCRYMVELFTRNGRLLVIRLDLGYLVSAEGLRPNVTLEQARADRERFFNYLRRSCPLDLKGYAWKLEDGWHKGYHYHTLLFFDGHKHWKGVDIAEQLGEQWAAMVGPQAWYWNCNAHWRDQSAVGIVDWKNGPKLRALFTEAAPYLTKGDFLISHAMEGVKTFSKGKLMGPPSRSGRPRGT